MRILLVSLVVIMLQGTAAVADQPIAEGMRTPLMAAVEAQGCKGGEMTLDEGKLEVENATCADGKAYDMTFDMQYRLIAKEADD